jgi:prepilin peptidase CpaA
MIAATVLVLASLVAAYTDLARRRISNVLTLGIAAVGLALSAMHGLVPFLAMLATYAAVLVAGTIPFSRGLIGGGDVKLLAAGAVCAGWPGCIEFLLVTSLAGGVLAVVELTRAHRLRTAFQELATAAYVGTLARGVVLDPQRRRLPYALAIAAGALILLASETIAPWLQLVRA